MGKKTLLCVITLSFILGCTTTPIIQQQNITQVKHPYKASEKAEVSNILSKIEERNRTLEDSPEWIEKSYEELPIRKLSSISEKGYEYFKRYLDNGAVYIIVHPAYYPFFQYHKLPSDPQKEDYKNNVVERFLSVKHQSLKLAVLQAQERRMRDFLEYKSTEEKLIILILAKNYSNAKGYTYKGELNEYMRYLNEVTNSSRSVIYVDSRSSSRGYPSEEDAIRLVEFLLSIKPEKVLIGGAYIGRCLEDFYTDFIEIYGEKSVYMVPELSDVSPSDLNDKLSSSLLMLDGSINTEVATRNLSLAVYSAQDVRPNILNLP